MCEIQLFVNLNFFFSETPCIPCVSLRPFCTVALCDPGVRCMSRRRVRPVRPFNCLLPRMEKIIPLNSTQFEGIKRLQESSELLRFVTFWTFPLSLYPRAFSVSSTRANRRTRLLWFPRRDLQVKLAGYRRNRGPTSLDKPFQFHSSKNSLICEICRIVCLDNTNRDSLIIEQILNNIVKLDWRILIDFLSCVMLFIFLILL